MYEPIFHYIDDYKNVVIPVKEYEKEQKKLIKNAFERGRVQGLIEALQLLQEVPPSSKEEILKDLIKQNKETKDNEITKEN